MAGKPACPDCASAEPVYKVSQIYVAVITRSENRSQDDCQTLRAVYGRENLSPAEVHQASQQFGPPSGRSQTVRPVHPDLAVSVFSLLALGFLINTFWVARPVFWVILALWLASLAGYALTRGGVVARYRAMENAALGDRKATEALVARWMKLYYCSEDGRVFDPDHPVSAPLEQLQQFMRQP